MKEPTIGSLIKNGQWFMVECAACDSISYISPDSTSFKKGVELSVMENFFACPSCGYCNGESSDRKLAIKPVVAENKP